MVMTIQCQKFKARKMNIEQDFIITSSQDYGKLLYTLGVP